jgi:hypothetical protein
MRIEQKMIRCLSKYDFDWLKLFFIINKFICSRQKMIMKSKTVTEKRKNTDNQRIKRSSNLKSSVIKSTETDPVYTELVGEGHEDFYNYLDWLGLAKKSDLLILTSSHHYYFEVEDLENVRTVVNLKNLNNIDKPKDFLQGLYSVLPHKCYFIGSFTDSKKQNIFSHSKKPQYRIEAEESGSDMETGRWNSFLNVLYGVIDAKTNRYMSEKSVRLLLEETGLKILDLTEFNGLTYFCAQKTNSSVE